MTNMGGDEGGGWLPTWWCDDIESGMKLLTIFVTRPLQGKIHAIQKWWLTKNHSGLNLRLDPSLGGSVVGHLYVAWALMRL